MCKEPIYPQRAKRKGFAGFTRVEITIDTNGKVINAIIVDSSGNEDLDNSALKAAMETTFKPISDKTKTTFRYEFNFK